MILIYDIFIHEQGQRKNLSRPNWIGIFDLPDTK